MVRSRVTQQVHCTIKQCPPHLVAQKRLKKSLVCGSSLRKELVRSYGGATAPLGQASSSASTL